MNLVRVYFLFFLLLNFVFGFPTTKLPAEIIAENETNLVEMYRIKIENVKNGAILISENDQAWQKIGSVIIPVKKTNLNGFTASKWGKSGSIVASAVNALHIKSGQNKDTDRGVLFSILPSNSLDKDPAFYNSYLDQSSSIYTNIRAGTEIFGGRYSVFVGDLIYLEKDQELIPLPYLYTPTPSDNIVIIVRRPEPYPKAVIFENRAGGLIELEYPGGKTKPIGLVLKPALGIGRFIGTVDTDVGRVRANHTGVIDISTSPLGKVGGFQIIPALHSESPEMARAKVKPQWMIVSSISGLDKDVSGLSPLFSGYIIPRYIENGFYQDNWKEEISKRTLITVKYKDKNRWSAMPVFYVDPQQPLPEKYETVLNNIEKIKIMFPLFEKKMISILPEQKK